MREASGEGFSFRIKCCEKTADKASDVIETASQLAWSGLSLLDN